MRQSRIESLVEVCLNIFIGWLVSMAITLWVVVPLWDLDWSLADSFWVTMVYTAAAILRGYVVRRFFNAQLHKVAHAIAKGVLK